MPTMINRPFALRLSVLALLAGGLLALSPMGGIARQSIDEPTAEAEVDAYPDVSRPDSDTKLDEMAWVDPVITGPVSPEYRRVREEAGCDRAEWPNIPDVCYPK